MNSLVNDLNEGEEFYENDFPAFPVVFQPQLQDNSSSTRLKSHLDQVQKKKIPQDEIKLLKKMISVKHQSKYSQFFTEQINQEHTLNVFFSIFKPIDPKFLEVLRQNYHNLRIIRIGAYKVFIGQIQTLDNVQKCQGNGVLIYKNGNLYEGQFKQNKRHGRGTYIENNIGWYQGQFNNDVKQGEGTQVFYNKAAYKGHFLNGLRHDQGIYVDANQNQYTGTWKLGIMHGKGYLRTPHSFFYGVFVNWLKHGQGQQIFNNGDLYKGQYQNGRFDGFGTYKWKNNNVQAIYQGAFKNGLRHGKGKWSENQTKYLGSYVEGLKEGYGELYFSSGNFYKGNFVQDRRQGYGQMFWTDGSFYKGEWKNGIQNGKGQIYLTGGQIISGLFQNSILVQAIPTIYQKQMQMTHGNELFSAEPRGILTNRERAFSQSRKLQYKKKLTKIDENVRRGNQNHSAIKSKMYFKSPQKSQEHGHSTSKHKDSMGRQCRCVKRLQNFRLKQRKNTKINESRFNNSYLNGQQHD